jgi:rare lipoprotein A
MNGLLNAAFLVAVMTACASPAVRDPAGYAPRTGADEEGLASWYGAAFQGRTTASGIPFDRRAMVAAHPSLAFGTRVRVHRVSTGASVDVEIVDRGPAAGPRRAGVVIDLSEAAARQLGFIRDGRTRVRIEVLTDSGISPDRDGTTHRER